MANILYISLTGMAEALGKSQVLEYLYDLSKDNQISLISFEREGDLDKLQELEEIVRSFGIHWEYLIYTNKYGALSTIVQLINGIKIGSRLIRTKKIDVMHARSMIPALMCAILKRIHNIKILFDIRDFSTDEKVDRNRIKKKSLMYMILKKLEIMLYRYSDFIVALTYISKEILIEKYNLDNTLIEVIPTCANKDLFKLLDSSENVSFKKSLGFSKEDKIIIHSGSVTGWYLFEKEVELIKELMNQNKNIKFLILNKGEHSYIKSILKKYGISENKYLIDSVKFEDVNKYLNIVDAAIYFIKPTFSKKAAAPTKFAELVACNVPSIINGKIGDMDMYLSKYDVGYIVDIDNIPLIDINGILDLIYQNNNTNTDYKELFSKYFDKSIAVSKYNDIYKKLIQTKEK